MNLTRKELRRLIKETIDNNIIVQNFIDELKKTFNVKVGEQKASGIGIEITKTFQAPTGEGCKVLLFIIIYDDNLIYLAELATLGSDNKINPNCYGNKFAKSTMADFLKIVDDYDLEVHLSASSKDKIRFPNKALVDFYAGYHFGYGNPNKGVVEMFRDKKSVRPDLIDDY